VGPAHLGVGFAAKPGATKMPLWVLLVASELLDLLSFGFVAIGIEEIGVTQMDFSQGLTVTTPGTIPWSHGLFMSIIWSVIFGAFVFLIYKDRRMSGILTLVVFSHWVLDFIVHPSDLPLLFNSSPKVGLGLWTTGTGFIFSLILEVCIISGGVAIYWTNKRRRTSEMVEQKISNKLL
jgi:membrane-bound metal-dependent hydrolase YbcI (DUF457 family)